MGNACRNYDVTVLAYCLMPNHVHLVVVPKSREGLINAISEAHEKYTKLINYRNEWKGHLWQGRFFSVAMDDDYLVKCVRYVELNPVRSNLCTHFSEYIWSSARAHLGGKDDSLVSVQPMLNIFPDWAGYIGSGLVDKELSELRKASRTGRPIGSDCFLKNMEEKTGLIFRKAKTGPKPKKQTI